MKTVEKLLLVTFILLVAMETSAQNNKITRIARLTIDPGKLQEYKGLLKEQMDAAIRMEPGVISYQVFADKSHPNLLTIVEVYANNNAYLAHREAPHFKKYKTATADMVKSLELAEVDPILAAGKNNKRKR